MRDILQVMSSGSHVLNIITQDVYTNPYLELPLGMAYKAHTQKAVSSCPLLIMFLLHLV